MTWAIVSGKKLCHQYPARLKFGNSRASVHIDWLAWRLARKHWNRSPGCRPIISATWPIVRCDSRLAVSNGNGSAPKLNWKTISSAVGFQGGQERLVDVRRINVALGWPGLLAPAQAHGHLVVGDRPVVDVRREMRRRRQDLLVRDALHVMVDGRVDVVERRGSRARWPAGPPPIGAGLSGVLPQQRSSS